jgi:hypothetical protein
VNTANFSSFFGTFFNSTTRENGPWNGTRTPVPVPLPPP